MGSGLSGGAAWDIATGKPLWKPTANTDNCTDYGHTGEPALVALHRCGNPSKPSLSVQTLDPATGQPLSTYKVSSAFTDNHAPSSKPPANSSHPGEGSGTKIPDNHPADKKTGKKQAHITIPDEKYAIKCKAAVGTCQGPVAGGRKLSLPTAEHDNVSPDIPGHTNKFTASDPTTHRPAPGHTDAGDGGKLFPAHTDNISAPHTPPTNRHSKQPTSRVPPQNRPSSRNTRRASHRGGCWQSSTIRTSTSAGSRGWLVLGGRYRTERHPTAMAPLRTVDRSAGHVPVPLEEAEEAVVKGKVRECGRRA
ncbi:hypothetical protein [Streptomyces hundungensis]|uniref:hypothetical protein n=1 Tax=Streptomyces hundungensis TaxID=1077946 RepID=UPI0031EF8AD6